MNWSFPVFAQTNVLNKGTGIFIGDDALFYISGSYTDDSDWSEAGLKLAGTLEVGGDFINNRQSESDLIISDDGDAGTVVFNGNGAQSIGGSSRTVFRNIELDKSANTLLLAQNIIVKDITYLTQGLLNLIDNNLVFATESLGSSQFPRIEKTNGRITATGTGYVEVNRDTYELGALDATNISGLGLGFESIADPLGFMTIRRRHQSLSTVANGSSVLRSFTFTYDGVDSRNLSDLSFHFDDAELNSLIPAELALYISDDGEGTWKKIDTNTGNISKQANLLVYSGNYLFAPNTEYSLVLAEEVCVAVPAITFAPNSDVIGTSRLVSSDDLNICDGEAINVAMTLSSGIPAFASWTFPDASISGNLDIDLDNSGVLTPTDFGFYSVDVINNFGCENDLTATFELIHRDLPVLDFRTYDPTTCDTETAGIEDRTVFGLNSGSVGTSTYSWDFGDTGTPSNETTNEPGFLYTEYGVKNVTMNVTTEYQCVLSLNKDISIFPLPEFDFTSEASICRDHVAEFDVNFTDGIPHTNAVNVFGSTRTFEWTFGDGVMQTFNNLNDPDSLLYEHQYVDEGSMNVELLLTFNQSGCSTLVEHPIAILRRPTAIFDPLFQDTPIAEICEGETILFNNESSISDDSPLTFLWDFDDPIGLSPSSTSTEQSLEKIYLTPEEYSYSVIAELFVTSVNYQNSAGEFCQDSLSVAIDVHPAPKGDFTIQDIDICLDESAAFDNNTTIVNGTLTYNWDFDDTESSNGSLPTEFHDYANSGDYNVSLTRTSNMGCANTINRILDVHPMPEAVFLFEDVCAEETLILSNNSVIQSDQIVKFDWDVQDHGLFTTEDVSVSYAVADVYSVELTVESNYGCKASVENDITVLGLPTFQLAPAITSDATFLIDPNNGLLASWPLGTQFVWRDEFDNILLNDVTIPEAIEVSESGQYTATLVPPGPLSCENTVEVTVVFMNSVSLGNVDSFCESGTLDASFSGLAEGSGVSTAYVWYKDNLLIADANDETLDITESGLYRVDTEITIVGGDVFESSDELNVTINEAVVVNVDDVTLCIDGSTTLDAGIDDVVYRWTNTDGDVEIGTDRTVIVDEAGIYRIEVWNGSCFDEDLVTVEFYLAPILDFSTTSPSFCQGNVITFINQSIPQEISTTIQSYAWDFGDGTVSSAINPEHTFVDDGVYNISLTAITSNGCSFNFNEDLTISENPSSDFTLSDICLSETLMLAGNANVGVFNYWSFGDGTFSSEINPMKQYSLPGMYTLELTVISEHGCSTSSTQILEVFEIPELVVENTLVTCGATLTLDAENDGADYLWRDSFGGFLSDERLLIVSVDGAYEVTITNTNGCDFTQVIDVELNTPITPDLKDDRSFCGELELDAGYFPGAIYAWSNGANSRNIVATESGTYIVNITDQNGCMGTDEVVLEFLESPTLDLGPDITVCANENVTLNAGNLGSTYLWSTSETTQSIDTTDEGLYSVVVTNPNGCFVEEEILIIHNPMPIVAFEFIERCTDQAIQFANQSTIDDNTNLIFSWVFGDGTASSDQNPIKTYSSSGDFDVSLTVTSQNGCVVELVKTVTVNPYPNANFVLSSYCESEEFILDNITTIADDSPLISGWVFGDGNTSSGFDPTHTYDENGEYEVQLTVTSVNNCISSISKLVTINELPVVDLNDNISTCADEMVLSAGNEGSTYLWSTFERTESITVNEDGEYSLELTDQNGCVAEKVINVNINETPTPALGPDITQCGEVVLDSQVENAGYLWSTGETTSAITIDTSGTYTVTVITTDLCVSEDEIEVVINPIPVIEFDNKIASCIGESIELDATSTNAIQYTWSSGQTDAVVDFTESGTYSVTLISDANCSFTASTVLEFLEAPVITFEDEVIGCDELFLAAGSIGDIYNWSNGDSGFFGNFTESGEFSLEIVLSNNCSVEKDFSVVINDSPIVELGEDQLLCFGESVILETGNTGLTYLWSDLSTNSTLEVGTTGVYAVEVTNEFDCVTADEVSVMVREKIDLELGDDVLLCSEDPLGIDAGLTDVSYSWSSDFGESSDERVFWPTGFGQIFLEVVDAFGCQARDMMTLSQTSETITASFLTPSIVDIGDTVQFSQLTEAIEATYVWLFGDGTISNLENPDHVYLRAGEFDIQLIASNEVCTDTLTKVINVVEGRLEDDIGGANSLFVLIEKLSLYPVPVKDKLNVHLELTGEDDVIMQIHDVSGTSHQTKRFSLQNETVQFDVSSLPSGMYLLTTMAGSDVKRLKFLIK